ncbi:MAG TPA: c-type cytochrome [SAR86 cluster bacterium]|jgi:cytochrome c553|nr:c-type cytochrome [SAR86 cluster bacterium]HJM15364.1 c-type cytochrome [SAR86 cluster bacterium]HJM59031.1 c-type cytochrome [SAR86 cluster bacterium]|tara:strand:- start:94 stop:381 length:288 start_codon:yes stop_codon:yes gene_type:complete
MKRITSILFSFLIFSSYLHTEIPDQWVLCSSCHGSSGEGGSGPKLQGKSFNEIKSDLEGYRSGKIKGPQSFLMFAMVGNLDEQDIEALAKYVETL